MRLTIAMGINIVCPSRILDGRQILDDELGYFE
jgi:hypothetical protein